MGNLTVIKNPFDHHAGRVVTPVIEGTTVAHIISKYMDDDFDIVVYINGEIVTDYSTVLKQGDSISVMAQIQGGGGGGGGKNILRTIALIVVAVVAAWVTGGASLGASGSLFGLKAGTFTAYALGAAVAVGGGLLVNAILPPPTPEVGSFEDKQDSNTYGWGEGRNQFNEGSSCAVLFGKHKIYPQIIGAYKDFPGYKDNLNVLFHICDGKINAIEDIKINDIPLASLGENVETSQHLGILNQPAPGRFGDTIYEQDVSHELVEELDEIRVTTDGNSVERLAVSVIIPGGLYKYKEGKYQYLDCRYSIEYREVGGPIWYPFQTNHPKVGMDMGYTGRDIQVTSYRKDCVGSGRDERCRTVPVITTKTLTYSDLGFTLSGNSPDTIRVIHEHDVDLPPDQYEIRIIRLLKYDAVSKSASRSNRMIVGVVQEKTLDDFTYPGRALLGISAVAQEKIYGGAPRISCVVDKSIIDTYAGEWGVGPVTEKPGNSPAWACYEMLTHPLFGAGIHPDNIELQEFSDWHDFCVAEGLEVNIYLDQSRTMFESINIISNLGRGSLVQRGTKFGAIWEETSSMVHMFTMGNIKSESMSMNYIEKENRTNTVEITYYDRDSDWSKLLLVQKSDETDSLAEERKSSIDYIGCTSRQQAVDYARFLLRSNEYLIRTVSFEADIDAVPVQPGDVFGLSHDIPLWGESGRLQSATTNTVLLEREVLMEPGETYNIIVRDDTTDTFETQGIVNPEINGYYSSLDLTGNWTTIPTSGNIYSFGQINKEVKLFRCTSVERSQDLLVRVNGLEYREEIYVNDPTPLPDYEPDGFIEELVGLVVDDNYKILPDGSIEGRIDVKWQGFAVNWDVNVYETVEGISKDEWNATVEQTNFSAIGIREGIEYTIAVKSPNGTILTLDYTPIIDPPEAVFDLTAHQIDNFVNLDWEAPYSELPVYKYRIWKGAEFADAVIVGDSDQTFLSLYETSAGTYRYWVAGLTESGLLGVARPVEIAVDIPPDFVAITDFCVDGTGAHTDTVWDGNRVIGPIDDTTTWEEWWDDVFPPSATTETWQDFIDAGYPEYLSPAVDAPLTANYTQTFDLGTIIGQGSISWEMNRVDYGQNGNEVEIETSVSYSEDDISYTEGENTTIVKANDFRYVKISSDFTSNGVDMTTIKPCFQVTAKKVNEVDNDSVSDATNGKVVTFDFPFYDIISIVVTPISTSFRSAVYDFTDVPNPTSFTVYLFDENGVKQTGGFSYSIVGI